MLLVFYIIPVASKSQGPARTGLESDHCDVTHDTRPTPTLQPTEPRYRSNHNGL